jgi:hypothetical protein
MTRDKSEPEGGQLFEAALHINSEEAFRSMNQYE